EKIGRLGGKLATAVVEIDLAGTQVSDDLLKDLKVFPHLETLDLSRTPISDKGVENLTSLAALTDLRLSGTSITDGAFVSLAKLPKLRRLDLDYTSHVSNEGIRRLRNNKELREL